MFRKAVLLICIISAAIVLIAFPHVFTEGTGQGLRLCAEGIIPFLFPYLVIVHLWRDLGYSSALSKQCETVTQRLFHLPGSAASAILIGAISGFPAAARTVTEQYNNKEISKNTAEQLLFFTSNAGPAFIFGTVGGRLFGSVWLGCILWLIHLFGAMLSGIVFRPQKLIAPSSLSPEAPRNTSAASTFVEAIRAAGKDVFYICVFVIFFSLIVHFLQVIVPLRLQKSLAFKILLCSLELSGTGSILKDTAPHTAFITTSALLAWNGVCVHFQVLSFTGTTDLSIKKYFHGKVFHILISIALSAAAAPLLFNRQHNSHITSCALLLFIYPLALLFIWAAKTSYRKRVNIRI